MSQILRWSLQTSQLLAGVPMVGLSSKICSIVCPVYDGGSVSMSHTIVRSKQKW